MSKFMSVPVYGRTRPTEIPYLARPRIVAAGRARGGRDNAWSRREPCGRVASVMLRVERLFPLLPSDSIAGLMSLQGPALRRWANNRPGRYLIRNLTHGGLGRLSVKLGRSAGLLQRRRPVELAMAILRYYFAPYLEETEIGDDEAVFYLKRCPYGWRSGEDIPLCDAVMQLEREMVAGIGGHLIIEETIPSGAAKCRFRLKTISPEETRGQDSQ